MPHPLEHRARAARMLKLPNSPCIYFLVFCDYWNAPSVTGRPAGVPELQVNLKPGKLRKNLTWLVDKCCCSSYIDPGSWVIAAEKEKEWNTCYLLLVWNSHLFYYSFGISWHDSWGVVSREPERERIDYDSLEQMDKRLYIYLPVAWWGLETYPQKKK